MSNSNDMIKIFKRLILYHALSVFFTACDKDFVEINTNPYAITAIDPALLLAGAQRSTYRNMECRTYHCSTICGALQYRCKSGFNFNVDIDGNSNPKWDQSYANGSNGNAAPVKNLIQALNLLGPSTPRVNLMSMIRIWKAQVFMGLVDYYGDVPYSEAGKAVSDVIFYPKYDDDAAIYDDLYKELKESIAALNPGGDFVSADLFYGTNAQTSTKTGYCYRPGS